MAEAEYELKRPETGIAPRLDPLPMDAQGRIVVKDNVSLRRMASNYISSGALPAHIKTVERFEYVYAVLSRLGVDPILSMKDTWWNDKAQSVSVCNNVPLAACQLHADFVDCIEFFVNGKNERQTAHNFVHFVVEGAACIVKRKGKEDVFGSFTYAEADAAGLRTKQNWRAFGPAMLRMRARSVALKKQFSDVLQGASILEYDDTSGGAVAVHAEEVDRRTPAPKKGRADAINAMFDVDEG